VSAGTRAEVEVRVHRGPAAPEGLRAEWSALWDRCPSATPFQSPEWLLAWWRHLGAGAEPWIVALRREGRLMALAPFYRWTHPESGVRQLTLAGNGITDRLDLLADPAFPDAGARILEHLARSEEWDTADFRDLPSSSTLLASAPPSLHAIVEDEDEPCPVLALPADEAGLADAVDSARLLPNLRQARRRAEKMGSVEAAAAGEAELAETLDALFRLHAARWRLRGEGGVLDDGAVRRTLADAAAGFLARGWLRLYALRVGGRTAAVQLGWSARGRAYYYIGGWDPDFAKLSPGGLLVEHAVREAVREGAREFDFLRGRESYKYLWGARDRPQHRLRLRGIGG
jgi:CelD/BcsL family acetyltransferase involved in cellulose biosynthesis